MTEAWEMDLSHSQALSLFLVRRLMVNQNPDCLRLSYPSKTGVGNHFSRAKSCPLKCAMSAVGAGRPGYATLVLCSFAIHTAGSVQSVGWKPSVPARARQSFDNLRSVAINNEDIVVSRAVANRRTVVSDGARSPRSNSEM